MSEDVSPGAAGVRDQLGRPLRSLRLSVTDRCNLRCQYCMPEPDYTWLPRTELLDFGELAAVVDAFTAAGVTRVRITGGEPLLRRDLHKLVRLLADRRALDEVALTTNGILLATEARRLADAGLDRVTVSLDTLEPARFAALTGRDGLHDVLAGLDAVHAAELDEGLKIDTVAIRGVNDHELVRLIELGQRHRAEVRFIEYMDVGGATQWSPERVLSSAEILARITSQLGPATPVAGRGSAPAARYALPDGTTFGIIASVTEPFCGACDRSRLTADGVWLFCLYAERGDDLKARLRAGASPEALAEHIAAAWSQRAARGAEERRSLPSRGALVPVDALRRNPHLEMHTRGG